MGTTARTESIDLLRGFIMLLMALDHASAMVGRRHFSELWGVDFGGYPSLGWWATRFVSHLCAPGFFFLMGMSIVLFAQKRQQTNWQPKQIRHYFCKRGGLILLFMFFLEFPAWGLGMAMSTVERAPVAMPGFYDGGFFLPTSVLYGLGACMILGSWLWQLKPWHYLGITVISFAASWWYISTAEPTVAFHPLEHFLIVPGHSFGALVIYPIIPWIGVMTFGMFWATLLQKVPAKIYPYSLIVGLSFMACFIALRLAEWGNFTIAHNDDWMHFFTVVKYPPSIAFALITIGINLCLFFVFSTIATQKWLHPIKIFGQTAMFFYIVHLYLYALMGIAFRKGCSIEIMYAVWALGLVILYFICQRFLAFKKRQPMDSWWRMV